MLRATVNKIGEVIAMIARLHAASLAPHDALPIVADST